MSVLNVEKLSNSEVVKRAIDNLLGLAIPKADITKYLDAITSLSEKDLDDLEKIMSLFIRWQNYFGEQYVIADALKMAAESQMSYYWSLAIESANGTINAKKELAERDSEYIKAKEVYNITSSGFNAIKMKFDMCERGYKLVSRIIAKRLNIKYE